MVLFVLMTSPGNVPPAAHRADTRFLLLTAVLILLAATGLRFFNLDTQSFWNDEGNSARLSERSIPLIIEGTASDIHPPLYYLLLRGWRELVGDTEFGLRSFSAFNGVLTVAVAVSVAALFLRPADRSTASRTAVLIAGTLAALNPALVYYSQETRMYALLALLAILATLFLLRWLKAPWAWPWAAAYVMTLTAGLYTHYSFPVVFILHGLFVLLWAARQQIVLLFDPQRLGAAGAWRRIPLYWTALALLSLLLYAPWLPVFLRQAGGREAMRGSVLTFTVDSLQWMALGETVGARGQLWALVGSVLLLIGGALMARRRSIMPILGVFVPILFMYGVGTTQPAFYKFMLMGMPFWTIALAAAFVRPSQQRGARGLNWLLWAGLAVLLAGTAVSLNNLYFNDQFARADYRGLAARIAAAGDENAGIILDAPNQWEVFTYYHRDGAPVYPLPKGQPDPALLEPELQNIATQHQRLYALFWGEEQRDPDRVVERWLDAHAYKASEEWVGDVRFVVYAVPPEAPTEMDTAVNMPFGDDILLQGYTLVDRHVQPGGILPVTLFWRTARPLDERYKVFLHLVDSSGALAAQRDSEPGGGLRPTNTWEADEQVIDNHGILLPQELAPGEYELLLGLYESSDPGSRLAVDGRADNTFSLGIVQVVD